MRRLGRSARFVLSCVLGGAVAGRPLMRRAAGSGVIVFARALSANVV
jgi:hypothetical protein